MTRRTSLLLCAAALILPAQNDSAPTFAVQGAVVDAVSGEPIPGAEVQIAPTRHSKLVESLLTGAHGEFAFNNLFAGKYVLSAAHAGYLSSNYQQHGNYNTGIVVGPGLSLPALRLTLERAASLSGTITDQHGDGVPNARIVLLRSSIVGGLRGVFSGQFTQTGSDGRYSVGKLRAGAYYIAVTAQPWYAQQFQALARAGATASDSSMPLDVAYPVTFYPGVTSADSASPVTPAQGASVQANIALTAVPAAHVLVQRAGQGNPNASLFVATRWGTNIRVSSMLFSPEGQSFSVAPGSYLATASWRDEAGAHSAARTIEVSGDVRIDPAQLSAPRRISLTVAKTGGRLEGRQASFSLTNLDTGAAVAPARRASGDEVVWTSTEAAGSRCELVLHSSEDQYIASISAKNARVAGHALELPPAGHIELTVTLARGEASLDGQVVGNGSPVSAAMVLLLPEDFGRAPSLIRRDQSDSDGTFSLTSIVPGKYTLIALPPDEELEYAKPEVMRPFLAAGKTVLIEPGKSYQVAIPLTVTSRS